MDFALGGTNPMLAILTDTIPTDRKSVRSHALPGAHFIRVYFLLVTQMTVMTIKWGVRPYRHSQPVTITSRFRKYRHLRHYRNTVSG
jgi:hypothetical protein